MLLNRDAYLLKYLFGVRSCGCWSLYFRLAKRRGKIHMFLVSAIGYIM